MNRVSQGLLFVLMFAAHSAWAAEKKSLLGDIASGYGSSSSTSGAFGTIIQSLEQKEKTFAQDFFNKLNPTQQQALHQHAHALQHKGSTQTASDGAVGVGIQLAQELLKSFAEHSEQQRKGHDKNMRLNDQAWSRTNMCWKVTGAVCTIFAGLIGSNVCHK